MAAQSAIELAHRFQRLFDHESLAKQRSQYLFCAEWGTAVPLCRSIAGSQDFLGNTPASMEKMYPALQYGTLLPTPNKENVVELAIDNVFAQILTGNVTPAQGLSQLDQQITAAL